MLEDQATLEAFAIDVGKDRVERRLLVGGAKAEVQVVTHCLLDAAGHGHHILPVTRVLIVPFLVADAAAEANPAALAFADEAIVAITLAATVHRVVEFQARCACCRRDRTQRARAELFVGHLQPCRVRHADQGGDIRCQAA